MKKVLLRLPLYLLAAIGLWTLGENAYWRFLAPRHDWDFSERIEKVIEGAVELNSLQLRDGLLYQSDEPEPFTGLVKVTGSGAGFLGRAWQGAVLSNWDRVVEGDDFSPRLGVLPRSLPHNLRIIDGSSPCSPDALDWKYE
jgi:hypothetical protein